jgi:hypothetical protein
MHTQDHIERPHFAHPFVRGGHVVEQDDPEHIKACATRVVLCPVGFRDDRPEFGWPWPEFANAPIDTDELRQALKQFEPRADPSAREWGDVADAATRHISVDLEVQSDG